MGSMLRGQTGEQQVWTVASSPTTRDLWGTANDGAQNFYAVGQGGTILSSNGGLNWQRLNSGTNQWLLGVTCATIVNVVQNLVIAVGDQGTILGSTDGTTWTQRASGGARLNGVAASGGLILAVGEGGAVARSTDGINWTQGNAGVTGWLRGIVYDGNRFLVAGQGGTLLATTDGVTFAALNSGTTADLESIAHGDGLYLIVGAAGFRADSTDGVSWTPRTPAANYLRGVATFGTQGVAVGVGGTIDATYLGQIAWQTTANATTADLYAVTATQPLPYYLTPQRANVAVAVGRGGLIATFAYGGYLPAASGSVGVSGPASPLLGSTVQLVGQPGLGASPLAYQWTLNGQVVRGASQSPVLTLPNVQLSDNGNYQYTISNAYGSASYGFILTAVYDPQIPNLVDEGFNPASGVIPSGPGGAAVQRDGKIIVLADPLLRLNADGTPDATFHAPTFGGGGIFSTKSFFIQDDGKLLVAWNTMTSRGLPLNESARLNPDGSLDSAYTPHSVSLGLGGATTQDAIPQIQLQDGRYLTWGSAGIQRLTVNGAIDAGYAPLFLPGVNLSGTNGNLSSVVAQRDASGRIVLGGPSSVPGGPSSIYRLNSDGTLDPSFTPAVVTGQLLRLLLPASGKAIYEATGPHLGDFAIARINTDGSADGTYPGLTLTNPSPTWAGWSVGPILATPDGAILVDIAGLQTQPETLPLIGGTYRAGLIRIDPNGTFDPAFQLNIDAAAQLAGLALQPDGNSLAWGNFPYFNAESRANFVRIFPAAGKNFASLANISARAAVGPGNQALIVGFVVATPQSKSLLLRGIGPGLDAFGVPGTLPDPQLSLYGSASNLILTENNWQDNGAGPAVAAAAARLGAFALADGSLDAAAIATVGSGSGSIAVTDANGASGVALAEAYDADATPPAYGGSRMVNFSCRSLTDSGAGVLTVGFVVGGANTKRVFLRAVGPSLASFGVTGSLSDPILTLYRSGTPIGNGTVGANSPLNIQTAQLVGAFPLPVNTRDEVMAITLSPGPYTAQVASASGAKGVVLLEVYEVP